MGMDTNDDHESTSVRIAIVGGGLAGLCLGRILQQEQQQGPSAGSSSSSSSNNNNNSRTVVTIYEAETSSNVRSQGGSLDIHRATGQRALRRAGLWKEFQQKVKVGADAMTVMNEKLEVLYEDSGDGSRPEIDRGDLRQLLLDSLLEGTIQWGKKLVSIKPVDDNLQLEFADGSVSSATVVVGADGAWSQVRVLLTNARPSYTGVSFVDAIYNARNTDLSALPKGTMFALDDQSQAVLGHVSQDEAHLYFAKKCERDSLSNDSIPKIVEGWAPAMRELAKQKTESICLRTIDALPVGLTWTRGDTDDDNWKRNIVLVGDAAHLMSPFAGEGANLALADAADLAQALVDAIVHKKKSIPQAISDFETYNMWPRASAAQKESRDNLVKFFEGKGATEIANWMREIMSWRGLLKMGAEYVVKLAWWLYYGYDYFY